MTLKYLIVDDEPVARSRLQRLICEMDPRANCSQAANGKEALEFIETQGPWSAIFLDIEMPGLNGFDVLKQLQKVPNLPYIIFCTAYPRYAIKAFESSAVDYLVKPIEPQRLEAAIKKTSKLIANQERLEELERQLFNIQSSAGNSGRHILCQSGNTLAPVKYAEIIYLCADHKLTRIVTLDRDFLSDRSLDEFEMELPKDMFFRTHRSALVNLNSIVSVNKVAQTIALHHQHVAPFSRRRRAALLKVLGKEAKVWGL